MKLTRRTFFPSLFGTPIAVKQVLEKPKVKEELVKDFIPIGPNMPGGCGFYKIPCSTASVYIFNSKNLKEM